MSDYDLSAFVNPSHRLKYPFKIFVKSQNLDTAVDSSAKLNITSKFAGVMSQRGGVARRAARKV